MLGTELYTNSGLYYFHTQNLNGCDSTAVLNITINNSSSSIETRTECDSLLEWN